MTMEQHEMINDLIIRKLTKLGKEFNHKTGLATFQKVIAWKYLNIKVDKTLSLFREYNLDNGKSCQWVEKQIQDKLPIFYNYYCYDFEE